VKPLLNTFSSEPALYFVSREGREQINSAKIEKNIKIIFVVTMATEIEKIGCLFKIISTRKIFKISPQKPSNHINKVSKKSFSSKFDFLSHFR
jgi:hypothetical protein